VDTVAAVCAVYAHRRLTKKKMGRLPRKDSALKVAERLALYAGYIPEIYDTKAQATLSLNRNPFHREP